MAATMKIDDKIRIQILETLMKKSAVNPNIRQIKRHTGFHKATIKSSLDFLTQEGVLQGYGPKVNFRKFNYNLEALVLYQLDMSNKQKFSSLLESIKEDPHLYRLSSVLGSGQWNVLSRHFYKDVESYHKETQNRYYTKPGLFDIVKDRQIFYATEPVYKSASRTGAIINIIKKDRGLD